MVEIIPDGTRPIVIGASTIKRFEISKITFMGYAECYRERIREQARTDDPVMATKAFNRARRLHQIKAFDTQGSFVSLSSEHFGALPRDIFIKISDALDDNAAPMGKIVNADGDGIYKPLIYQLGTPFDYQDSKLSEKPIGTESKIIELEFIAKTGGEIEDVLCHDNNLDQTVALIKTCATPLGGGETGLLRLPSWMLSELTLSDGFEIMRKVLPVFLK